MCSIWDSPAWRSLGNFTTTPGNLTFSYFIDWFNPLTNKIAGKTVSCGAIMLFCLNLPYEVRHLPENTFFAGITPPPREPNIVTITNLVDPIIDRFDHLYRVGKPFRTYNHPDGVHIRVGILPAIGDIPAMRKAMGFAGVGSNLHFCAFCYLHKDNIEELDPAHFLPRIGTDVTVAAQSWQEATTKKERESLFRSKGVRWSSLHLLGYRDPVRHTVLGLMHNWIEGILQHHARVLWGIGVATVDSEKTKAQKLVNLENDPTSGAKSDDLSSTSDPENDFGIHEDELQQLHLESQQHSDTPQFSKRQNTPAVHLMEVDCDFCNDGELSSDSDDGGEFLLDEATAEQDDQEIEENVANAPKIFNASEMTVIHMCLSDVVVPSWVARPPTNLGQSSHGKLKADQWLILFSVFLPLILPEIWLADGSKRKLDLLDNFEHLVTCTNIICSHSTSNDEADRYLQHYILYRRSVKDIFPYSKSRPNHHYAMHNADLLKFWGPLIQVSEYPYETHNGTLQRIKTNNHLWELDFTMLRNICRRGRLAAIFERTATDLALNPLFSAATNIFQSFTNTSTSKNMDNSMLSEEEAATFNGSGSQLPEHIYAKLLSYLSKFSLQSEFRHRSLIPHPADAQILSDYAQLRKHVKKGNRSYSTYDAHHGNSSVSYHNEEGAIGAGFIDMIFEQVVEGRVRVFFVIAPHSPLNAVDELTSPYRSRPGFLANIVYDEPYSNDSLVIAEANAILGHVPFYRRPAGTFGISRPTIVIINSLHRER
ncbi:hypothetical protein MD484_g4344, partial [Candolleomyces efflorescens]